MPSYDLKCQDCGTRFERFFMRLIRTEDRVCPSCGSTRVVTGPGGGVVAVARTVRSDSGACGSGGFT
ncbi:MAG: FmdB family zinc ribbon protein [Anaerosomatales bacterium]|nr:zinc ribbon domain-containing protein [Coriobacteriia bacterium]